MTHSMPLLTFILIRIIYEVIINIVPLKRRLKMIRFSLFRRTIDTSTLFNGHYVDVRTLYVLETNMVPCICFIGEIDITKAFDFISENFRNEVRHVYQHSFYDHELKDNFFNNNIFVLKNDRMIELQNNFCHVLLTRNDYEWAHGVMDAIAAFRMQQTTSVHTTIIGFARQTEMN